MAKIYGNTTTTPLNPEKFGSTGKPYADYMLLTSDNLLDDISAPQKFIFQVDCTFYDSRGGALDFILKAQAGTVLYATFKPKVLGGTQLRIYEFIGSVTTQQSGTPPFEYSRNIIVEYDTGTGDLTIREPKMDKFADVTNINVTTPYAKEIVTDYELMIGSKNGACFISGMSGLAGIYRYPYDGGLAQLELHTPEGDAPYAAANKLYVDTAIGSIETALDSIIAIQNQLIGGGE